MDYKIEKAKLEDLDAIHKLIYDRCLWFSEKGVKGWNVDFYPNKYDKSYFIEQMKINNKKYLGLVCYQESKFLNEH